MGLIFLKLFFLCHTDVKRTVIYFGISVILGILEIFAVSQGIVGIRGVFSNKFLAMSKKGKLHASVSKLPLISMRCLLKASGHLHLHVAATLPGSAPACRAPWGGAPRGSVGTAQTDRGQVEPETPNPYPHSLHLTEKSAFFFLFPAVGYLHQKDSFFERCRFIFSSFCSRSRRRF